MKEIKKVSEEKIIYLGDGVYAEFDGEGIWLRTGDHRAERCDQRIFLENEIVIKLINFYKSMGNNNG